MSCGIYINCVYSTQFAGWNAPSIVNHLRYTLGTQLEAMVITQCGSTVYIGIAQVTWHQPCTLKNSSFHFHYAFHFTFKEISVKKS